MTNQPPDGNIREGACVHRIANSCAGGIEITYARERRAAFITLAMTGVLASLIAGCTQADSAQRSTHTPAAHQAAGAASPRSDAPSSGTTPATQALRLLPAKGRGHLAPGSRPSALPGDVLIADEDNHRLLLVDPQGRIRWRFPARGDSVDGRLFGPPDDAFFSSNGKQIVATQETYDTISVINVANRRIIRKYGHPDIPGSARNFFSHPDDAMLLPGGELLTADIMNCRILLLSPGRWHVIRQFGRTGLCVHHPPGTYGSPNGVFPLSDGHFLVTEINGDWVDEMNLRGHIYWSVHPPGVVYPSDACEFARGRYIVTDYSSPGQIVIFNRAGRALWRFRPLGKNALNHPSLAVPLPNGDILVNDDYNDRVIVINPRTKRIVWQYGHLGVAGRAPGFLANPDGVDMAPPNSLLISHAATLPRF